MRYWIDFSGFVSVEAGSKEDAEQKMWDAINRTLAFPTCFEDDEWYIDGIEERSHKDLLSTVYPTAQDLEDFWYDK